jgi:putative aminopeptidase FrvX
MNPHPCRRVAFLLSLCAASATAQSDEPGPYARAVSTWIALAAAPGYERTATDRIMTAQDGWTRDTQGNLIHHSGEGTPRRVVACGLDAAGYAVSEITDDGYVRVHVNGNGRHVALWDQFHEGQRAYVATAERPGARSRVIPGVFAVRSNHLWRRRAADDTPTTIENLWLDVGARSRAEVERMGVRVLDGVFREWPQWTFGEYVAGPGATSRAGCEAVAAAAANARPRSGETIFIISTQRSFGWAGLTGALARLGHVDSIFIADAELAQASGNVTSNLVRAPWAAFGGIDARQVVAIAAPARFSGTLAETLREGDIESLHHAIARAAGIGDIATKALPLIDGWAPPPPALVQDSLSKYANVLGRLSDIYALSGHEQTMRDAIQPMLPAWARDAASVDSAGNLIVPAGPDRDTTVIVAHMDEIGFTVSRITANGTVQLRPRGTFFPFLWEGQPALLHRDDDKVPARDGRLGCGAARGGPLRGVFIPRDSSAQKEPPALTAWFGLDSAALVAAGVSVGSPVTGFKCSALFGDVRLAARSIDDRAGVTSLISAIDEMTPGVLDHKVLFVFSVREEGGLEGAKALAASLGPSVHRVHAVDTFVSSDSPLESRRFAYAPIGQGAVVRALDNSSVTPPDEIDRVARIARAAGIPLQMGVTNGGNDGSEFVRWGAVNVALAWPLRYSHSPAELIDLRDLRSLARIVAAVAQASTRAPAARRSPLAP